MCDGLINIRYVIIKYMEYLGKISEIRSGYTFRSSLNDYAHGNTNVIQAKDITKLTNSSFPKVQITNANHYLQDGDILLSVRGDFKAEVFHLKQKSVASSSIIIIKPKNGIVPEYLALYLNSTSGQNSLKSIATGASIRTLTISELSNLKVPITSADLQQRLILFSRNVNRQQELIKNKTKLLDDLLNSVTTITIKGESND